MDTFSSETSNDSDWNMPCELSPSVRERLDAFRRWDRRRETGKCAGVTVGHRVRYKDEPNLGLVTDLLDGREERKFLIGQPGAMVSFGGRAAVPVFLWALEPVDDRARP